MAEKSSNGLAFALVGCGLLLGLGICGGALTLAGVGGVSTYFLSAPSVSEPPPLPPDVAVAEPAPVPEPETAPAAPKSRPVEPAVAKDAAAGPPTTEPEVAVEAEAEAGTGAKPVTVDGPARVTLVGGGRSFALPAVVPEGRYTIRAAFEGEQAVEVGNARITAAGGEVIACNPNMGICRVR